MEQLDKSTPVGFIGLGTMGRGMAHGLLRAGYPLHVYARQAQVLQDFVAAGAHAAASPAQLGRGCRVVVVCVSDGTAVEQVLFGAQGLAEGLAAGSVVIDTSTIAAEAERAFGARLRERGVHLLDAPISGGQAAADAGTLNTMVGGPPEVFAACRELLAAFCRTITHVGPLGAGQAVKSCNQVAVAGALLGVADAIALARSQGIDPALMREVLLAGSARSFALERHAQRIIDADFKPAFRARLMRKDLRIALQTAQQAGAPLTGAALVERMLDALCETGRGDLDWTAIAAPEPR